MMWVTGLNNSHQMDKVPFVTPGLTRGRCVLLSCQRCWHDKLRMKFICATMPTRSDNKLQAFTLIEVIVVIVLIGFLVGISIPTFNALAGTELRTSANQMQGLLREIYSRSALSYSVHRLVIDIDNAQYWVEAEEQQKASSYLLEEDSKGKEEKAEIQSSATREDAGSLWEQNIAVGPVFKPIEGMLGQKNKLKSGVRFLSFWVRPMKEKVREGLVAIHVFPGGFMDKAFFSITDSDSAQRLYSIITEPLTGQSYIEPSEPEVDEIDKQ